MASLYSAEHRALQEEFNTTKLAALLDNGWIHDKISEDEKNFISTRDMFFLSTVDVEGMPTVSYKGGGVGFVKVLDDSTLVSPGFDGNGMFYSVGNIDGQGKVGMLFIDFETPHRVRVQGTATLERDHPLLAEYTEAKYLIMVKVSKIWVNFRDTFTNIKNLINLNTCRSLARSRRSRPGNVWISYRTPSPRKKKPWQNHRDWWTCRNTRKK